MGLVALDTNLYIRVARGIAQTAAAIDAAAVDFQGAVVLAPVYAELLQGARDDGEERVYRQTIERRVGRVLAPSHADWREVGRAVRRMQADRTHAQAVRQRSTFLDLVNAVVCRAHGVTLLTSDADHEWLHPYAKHAFRLIPT